MILDYWNILLDFTNVKTSIPENQQIFIQSFYFNFTLKKKKWKIIQNWVKLIANAETLDSEVPVKLVWKHLTHLPSIFLKKSWCFLQIGLLQTGHVQLKICFHHWVSSCSFQNLISLFKFDFKTLQRHSHFSFLTHLSVI